MKEPGLGTNNARWQGRSRRCRKPPVGEQRHVLKVAAGEGPDVKVVGDHGVVLNAVDHQVHLPRRGLLPPPPLASFRRHAEAYSSRPGVKGTGEIRLWIIHAILRCCSARSVASAQQCCGEAALVAQRASGLQALAGHAMPAGTAALRPTGSNSALDTRKALAVPLCRDT